MTWLDSIAEERIKEAMERGEFDDLSCAGRPLDLDEYFSTPEQRRLEYSILKNAGFIPEEVQLLKEIESLKAASAKCDDVVGSRLRKLMNEKRLKLDLRIERYKRR